MKKILLFLSFFFLFTFNSTSKEIDYSLLDVSDLLKKGFKIIKQDNKEVILMPALVFCLLIDKFL